MALFFGAKRHAYQAGIGEADALMSRVCGAESESYGTPGIPGRHSHSVIWGASVLALGRQVADGVLYAVALSIDDQTP